MPTTPNLFRRAQREVHQDALVAYLFDWLQPDVAPELRAAAESIVSALVGAPVDRVESVETQWSNVDVVATAQAADGRRLVIVIENKTGSTEHSEQLARYRESATHAFDGRQFVGVYLKTGWLEPRDEQASAAANYRLVDRRQWLDMLTPHHGVDAVLDQYIEFLAESDAWHQARLEELDDPAKANDALKHAHVKWALMARLFPDSADAQYWGTNVGGSSWVQRRVATVPLGLPRHETLFWRIDHRKPRRGADMTAYVALRAYEVFDRSDSSARAAKVSRLNDYRTTFNRVHSSAATFGCQLQRGTPVADNKGAYESEIATFFVNDNSVGELAAWIAELSARFVSELDGAESSK